MYSIQQSEADFLLSSYRYELPPERIAQHPGERGASRLLVLDRDTGKRIHSHFSHLLEYLPKGTLLIANNSRVVPARMIGQRPSGGKMEFLLLTPMPLLEQHGEGDGWHCAEADGLIKPAKNARIGDHLVFGDDLRVEVLAKGEFGRHRVRLHWTGDIRALFESRGHLPLPPYIKEELEDRSLHYLDPVGYEEISKMLSERAGEEFLARVSSVIELRLKESGIEGATIKRRARK